MMYYDVNFPKKKWIMLCSIRSVEGMMLFDFSLEQFLPQQFSWQILGTVPYTPTALFKFAVIFKCNTLKVLNL